MDQQKSGVKSQQDLIKSFGKSDAFINRKIYIIFALFIVLGVGTGYLLSIFIKTGGVKQSLDGKSVVIEKGKIIGSDDTETFKDMAEGVLKEGGFEGEGEYHLERPGGESQSVYLISSVIDLSIYVDKKLKVWGKTEQPKKVGWLMDVGRLQVL